MFCVASADGEGNGLLFFLMFMLQNWGLWRALVWWLTGGSEDRKVMWLSTKGCMAVTERYMQLPSSLRVPFALISTRSGTKLEKTSLSAGGLKCPLEKLVSRI